MAFQRTPQAIRACTALLHRPLPADPCRPRAGRGRLGTRDQARRLPLVCSKGGCGSTPDGRELDRALSWIVQDVGRLDVDHAIIDAECCCDGDNGITDFDRLQGRGYDEIAYAYAFDLLAIDGTDTRALPLSERKAALAHLLRKAKPGIRYSEHITGDGRIIFEHACKMGLEGIVSKRINSPYRSGKVKTWLKVKNPKAAAVLRVQEGG